MLKWNKVFFYGASLILLLSSCQKKSVNNQQPHPASKIEEYGRYIITLHEAVDQESVLDEYGVHSKLKFHKVMNGFSANLSPALFRVMSQDKRVKMIEPDFIVSLPPDMKVEVVPLSTQILPAGVDRIDADLNLFAKIDTIDERVDIDIGIIDTGCDSLHPDLNVYRRLDFTGEGVLDGHGHGTHVAGTVAAIDNTIGVVGVAPGARIWSIKVLDSSGSGFWSWIIAGLDFAAVHSGEIEAINLSLGGSGYLQAVHDAIRKTVSTGIVIVVAAGNSYVDIFGSDGIPYTNDDFLPACLTQCMSVSAMTDLDGKSGGLGGSWYYGPDDAFAGFTNYSKSMAIGNPVLSPGAGIDLAGPGVNVLSTYKGGAYARFSGTSMASPHITGAVALYIAENGRAFDSLGVWNIRQNLIDKGEFQSLWRTDGNTQDPDGNPENLVSAGNSSGNPGNRKPVVRIISPLDNSAWLPTDTITFEGNALDLEDGDISYRLQWTSSIDGSIGSGPNFTKTGLSLGMHTIQASTIDDSGAGGVTSITIIIQEAPLFPPTNLSVIQVNNSTLRLSWLNATFARDWVLIERSDKSRNGGWTAFTQIDSVLANGGQQSYDNMLIDPLPASVIYRLRAKRDNSYSDYSEIVRYHLRQLTKLNRR